MTDQYTADYIAISRTKAEYCRMLDTKTCRCRDYENRKKRVPDCTSITVEEIGNHARESIGSLERQEMRGAFHQGKFRLRHHHLDSLRAVGGHEDVVLA